MRNAIAITGAPGSGKTTLAAQLALAVQHTGQGVLVVFCDGHLPPKSYLQPTSGSKEIVSLGQLLTATQLSELFLWDAMCPAGENLAAIGYGANETSERYPCITYTGAARLLDMLEKFEGTVVFDCTDALTDVLSQAALKRAEAVVVTLTADAKSAAWHKMQRLPQRTITVLNKVTRGQAIECFDVAFQLCHVNALAEQFETQCLWEQAKDKAFCKKIQQLATQLQTAVSWRDM
ncbi:MAG: hypothetical protein RSE54_07975 [Ruthenibacterium sp.]